MYSKHSNIALLEFDSVDARHELCPYSPIIPTFPQAPVEMIGLIIGRSGETITRIKQDTHTEIDIGLEPTQNPALRAVQISGDSLCVSRAKTVIQDLLQDAKDRSTLRRGTNIAFCSLNSQTYCHE